MHLAEARASGSTTGLRDPFAWREALTPPNNVSPASTARSSRAGSFCGSHRGSNAGGTPTSNTPPESPLPHDLSARSIGSVRSGISNTSSRSGGGRIPMATPSGMPNPHAEASRSWSSGSGAGSKSGRSSAYVTPNSSARTQDFGSVYDSQSHCGSARTADLCSVYENEAAVPHSAPSVHSYQSYHTADQREFEIPEAQPGKVPSRKKQRAYAAAFDSFVPTARQSESSPSGAREPREEEAPVEASLDPRQVFSSARHGRHKEVEASLAAGFDPSYMDSFGNTLFHVACQNGIKRIAKLAIKYGGDMDHQNLKGNTGIHFLFAYGYPDVGEYFIEKGASDSILNEVGKNVREGIR